MSGVIPLSTGAETLPLKVGTSVCPCTQYSTLHHGEHRDYYCTVVPQPAFTLSSSSSEMFSLRLAL